MRRGEYHEYRVCQLVRLNSRVPLVLRRFLHLENFYRISLERQRTAKAAGVPPNNYEAVAERVSNANSETYSERHAAKQGKYHAMGEKYRAFCRCRILKV